MCTCDLRPHHALCTRFFTGKGYSPEFTRNMERVLGQLRGGAQVRMVAGADSLCAACPNLAQGVCSSAEKVERYDAAVLALCGIEPGRELNYAELSALVDRSILAPRLLDDVCGDCEWHSLCREVMHSRATQAL